MIRPTHPSLLAMKISAMIFRDAVITKQEAYDAMEAKARTAQREIDAIRTQYDELMSKTRVRVQTVTSHTYHRLHRNGQVEVLEEGEDGVELLW